MQRISLEPPQKNEDEQPDEITLMTLHASKGLEFPVVYIVGCEENLLPHANSLNEPALSEERRLFYVGITRAKKYLTLTRCTHRKKMYEMIEVEPPRFIKDIPEHTIDISENGKSEAIEKLEAEQDAVMRERFARMKALLNK